MYEKYQTQMSYDEATKIIESKNGISNIDTDDTNSIIALILVLSVESFNAVSVNILESLTGLDFSTKKDLYNYFSRTITFTNYDIAKYSMLLFVSLESDDSDNSSNESQINMGDIADIIRKMMV